MLRQYKTLTALNPVIKPWEEEEKKKSSRKESELFNTTVLFLLLTPGNRSIFFQGQMVLIRKTITKNADAWEYKPVFAYCPFPLMTWWGWLRRIVEEKYKKCCPSVLPVFFCFSQHEKISCKKKPYEIHPLSINQIKWKDNTIHRTS